MTLQLFKEFTLMCLTSPRNPGLRIPLPLCQDWIRGPFRSLPALTLGDCMFLPLASLSLVAQTVKKLPAMQETQVRSLGREDPLEKEMATQSSILAWRTRMNRGACWAAVGHRVGLTEALSSHAWPCRWVRET